MRKRGRNTKSKEKENKLNRGEEGEKGTRVHRHKRRGRGNGKRSGERKGWLWYSPSNENLTMALTKANCLRVRAKAWHSQRLE